jgi:hypothetical protein
VSTPAADDSSAIEPPRGSDEKSMTIVPFDGFNRVRIGLIGLGNRGGDQDRRFAAVGTVAAV